MSQNQTRTEISSIGEFGLIQQLAQKVQLNHPETIYGMGDDCAVMAYNDLEWQLITTDLLVEGVHFDLSFAPLAHLGYKAVAVNVSDIAAMNGIPLHMTVSLAISNRFSVEAIEELYKGIRAACEHYKVDLVGGDTTASTSGLMISITVLGKVLKEKIVYRHTAQKGDLLCVTGDLGGAFLGLKLLQREKQIFQEHPDVQPDLEGKDEMLQRQLKPEARMDMVYEFETMGLVPTSMIDISDGLASEIMHISSRSKLGVRIYEDKLPISEASLETLSEFQMSSTACVLNGGEDYELLFTIKPDDFDKVKNHPDISIIGYMAEPELGLNLVTTSNQLVPLQAQGWVHFPESANPE